MRNRNGWATSGGNYSMHSWMRPVQNQFTLNVYPDSAFPAREDDLREMNCALVTHLEILAILIGRGEQHCRATSWTK
jgi:hypothetical protein